jgi:hypothetical protein
MIQIRDMRDEAHALIDGSKLNEAFRAELRGRFDIVGNKPTAALDVLDEHDEETGAVTKSASEKLREAVTADIEKARELADSVAPKTQVRGQGASTKPKVEAETPAVEENEDGKEERKPAPKSTGSALTDEVLAEAGIDVTEGLYEGITN